MLTPEYMQQLPDELVQGFLQLEEQVIFEISQRLSENLSLMATDEHQIKALLRMGYDIDDIEKALLEQVELTAEQAEQLMLDAARLSYETDQALYKKGGKDLPDLEENYAMQNFINSAARETKDRLLNLSNSLGFAHQGNFMGIREFYVNQLNFATLQVASGLYDHNAAIRQTVNALGDRGIVSIDFETSRKYDIESHIRTSLLTGINQITGYMSEANADLMDQDLMEITAHIGARPSHADWQGQIVSRSGRRGYLSLDDIGYGDILGFKGINCRHDWHPYFEGISTRNYTENELKNIDPPDFTYKGETYSAYDATQKQRYFERQMRKSKRKLIGYDAAEDKDMFTAESIKLSRLRKEYKEFSKAAKIRPKNERHFTYNYDRSMAAKARWAANK